MIRVERHIFTKNKDMDKLCFLSKNLYNYCNYLIRQEYIKNKRYIDEYELTTKLAKDNQIDYRSLPAQTSQQIIKLLFKNWKSFYKSIKDYSKNKSKYKGQPKLPKYKDKIKGRNIVIFTNQNCKLKDNFIYFPKNTNLNPLKTKVNNFKQIRILPNNSCFIVEIIYEKEIIKNDLNDKLFLGIDLGINNLATLISNSDNNPLLLNGKIIKSINHYYNKKRSLLMSFIGNIGSSNRLNKLELKRKNKINDYLHKSSRFIINYCIKNKIKNIVIGYNKNWKNNINIGKVNNQKFVCIPYLIFINQIKYKAEENEINVIINEESYTSKCDSLILESLYKHDVYLGKRIKRGLFQSSIGKLINADVNASINILRKVIGDYFVKDIIDIGFVGKPLKVKNS